MTRSRRNHATGFTLVELMIVVTIVGILSVLTGYGVRRYVASAKTAEARNALGQIAKDAVVAFERDSMGSAMVAAGAAAAASHNLCKSASASVPASSAAIAGRKYQSSASDWSADAAGNSGFACLKFEMDQAQYYAYSYAAQGSSSSGDSFTASARGDLNGDGVLSLFQLTGAITAQRTLSVSPNFLEVRSDE